MKIRRNVKTFAKYGLCQFEKHRSQVSTGIIVGLAAFLLALVLFMSGGWKWLP